MLLSFGATLPDGVSAGTPATSTVNITDDDHPQVTVTDDDNPGDLRLVDGVLTTEDGQLCEGRLEIFYNGAWGTICDDYWAEDNADVACRALGFVGGSVEDYGRFRTAVKAGFSAGASDQQIWLDDLLCTGNEYGLLECPLFRSVGSHNCRHTEDVGLRCIKNSEGPHVTGMEISGSAGRQRSSMTWARR